MTNKTHPAKAFAGFALALALISFAFGVGGAWPPKAQAAPIDPPVKITAIHNTAASADTGVISGGFQTSAGYPVEAIRITLLISGVSTTFKLTCSDGNTTEKGLTNSGTALTVGEWYTFTAGIADVDEDGDTLTWNLEFEDATTIDVLIVDRARVGSP